VSIVVTVLLDEGHGLPDHLVFCRFEGYAGAFGYGGGYKSI